MRTLFTLLLLFSTSASAVTFSSPEEQVPTIELFTSQGCSSCPPADRWLSRLVDHPDLWKRFVPLAFHVDYWDYIGWKDPFAHPNHSLRQQHYKKAGNIRSVYTPGFVLAGKEWRGFFYRQKPTFQLGPKVGRLSIDWNQDNSINAHFEPTIMDLPQKLELHLAILGFDFNTPVGRGENSGKSLREDFVVLGWNRHPVELSKGRWQVPKPRVGDERPKRRAVVAWITKKNSPVPLQAVGGWL